MYIYPIGRVISTSDKERVSSEALPHFCMWISSETGKPQEDIWLTT